MKKNVLLLSFVVLAFVSCSKNDDEQPVNEPQLTTNGTILKRAVSTNGTNTITEDYFYNYGNQLQKTVSSNGTKIEYSYTGNLITQTLYFENNVLKEEAEFQYNSGEKMTQRKVFNYSTNNGYRVEYTYNIDGTVTVLGFSGTFTTQNTQIVNRKVFLLANGDVEKIEKYVVINGNNQTITTYYTYDTKNTPSNAIIGYSKIKLWDSGTSGNSHNNTSILYTSTESTTSYPSYTDNMVFTYNSFDFPMTSSYVGNSYSVQYFYL